MAANYFPPTAPSFLQIFLHTIFGYSYGGRWGSG